MEDVVFYTVVVVSPRVVKKNLKLSSLKETDLIFLKDDGTQTCPHLSWNKNKAICAIHHYSWFKNTPCGQFTQEIEKSIDNPYRLGEFLLKPENNATLKSITRRTENRNNL